MICYAISGKLSVDSLQIWCYNKINQMERGDFINIQNIKGLAFGTMLTVGLLVPSVHTIKDNGVCASSATAGVISATGVDLTELPTVESTEVEVVAEPEPQWVEMDVPSNNSFKSYMGAHKITDTNSAQYQFKSEYLDSACGIKLVDGDCYVVALGTYYTTKIGTRVDLVMCNDSIVRCVVGDIKANKDTDAMNRQHNVDNSVVEFIVNTNTLCSEAKSHGDASYCDPRLMGEIKAIRVYKEN